MKTATVIGAGPAGVSAAIYLVRAGINTTVVYKGMGALGVTKSVENYYGFENPISGPELFNAGVAQIKRLGAKIVEDEIVGLKYGDKLTALTREQTYPSDVIVIATGTARHAPHINGLKAFEGRGVSYCAVCDAFFYQDCDVAVLGTGDYAMHEASELLPTARSVTLFTQGKPLTSQAIPQGLKIDTRKIKTIEGGESLESLELEDGTKLQVSALFVAVGIAGSSDLAKKIGAQVDGIKISVDQHCATTIEGLYACGDCTGGMLQIAKAVYDGALAAKHAIAWLRKRP